ncbi:unnamed protein product [Brassica napus]|uniref:(rape) hypothetical protein n=1 Tax=Brassica napus TaxID=3708 RepID=A0A817BF70_BRANA|nr:unnamed protein product [Brassica napus]
MVRSVISMKALWHSEVHNEQKWAANMKLVRALGVFAGGIFFMRNYGDLIMALRFHLFTKLMISFFVHINI